MAREQLQTLTEPMYYILMSLLEECCGVDIMEKVNVLSRGRVTVGPGTLYAMLARFENSGIIRLTASEGRRKSYVITEEGRKILQKEYDRLKVMVEDGSVFWGDSRNYMVSHNRLPNDYRDADEAAVTL